MKRKIMIGVLLMSISLSLVACSFGNKDTDTQATANTEMEYENEDATEKNEIKGTEKDTVPSIEVLPHEESHTEKNPEITVSEPLPPLLTPTQEETLIKEQLEANNDWIVEFRETKGCPICGEKNCASLYGKDKWGQDDIDVTLCPDYTIEDDPLFTCTHCGKEKGNGKDDTCVRYLEDTACEHCGDEVLLLECHTCEK